MNFAEAVAVLKKDVEEDKNWRSARAKLAEVVEAAMTADASLQACCDKEAQLRASVAALEHHRDELQRTILDQQRQIATFADDLAKKQQLEASTLADVRAQREAEEAKLDAVQHELEALKAKLHR